MHDWLARHPAVRDAIIWAVPAILFGAALRILLLSYSPFAYWGSDSASHYYTAERFLLDGDVVLQPKRRYVYPLLMIPLGALPGAPLRWVALFQHASGILSLLPLAYATRKTFLHWRWLIVPITVAYAGIPIVIWEEHEVISESLFFSLVAWSMGGWIAWISAVRQSPERRAMWWCFFIPFALLVLSKPAARFFWPGLVLSLAALGAWRLMDRKHAIALVLLFCAGFTVGEKGQGAWLAYNTAFALTRLDTPLHAQYKAQIRDLVERARTKLPTYYNDEDDFKEFLKAPDKYPDRPLWAEIKEQEKRDGDFRAKLYMDLAKEGIRAEPHLFLYVSLQRVIGSANPDFFKETKFLPQKINSRFQQHYNELSTKKPRLLRHLFALPKDGPLPDYESIKKLMVPHPDSQAARWLADYLKAFELHSPLTVVPTKEAGITPRISQYRPTLLGCWVLAGLVLALTPPYWRMLGIWTVICIGYLFGVFLVGSANPRYFGAVWPFLCLVLGVPADLLLRALWAGVCRLRPPVS